MGALHAPMKGVDKRAACAQGKPYLPGGDARLYRRKASQARALGYI